MKIALDFDGTVVDTMSQLAALAEESVQKQPIGISCDLDDVEATYMETIGAPFGEQLRLMYPRASDTWRGRVEMYFNTERFCVYDVARVISASRTSAVLARDRGWDVYVVSSTPMDIVTRVLMREGFLCTVFPSKLGKTRQLEYLKPDVFIGDAPRDAEYAEEARIPFIGIETTIPERDWPMHNYPVLEDVFDAMTYLEMPVYASKKQR